MVARHSASLRIVALAIGMVILQACTSSTLITSSPEGARVYIDGQRLGKAPVTQRE